MFFFEFSDADSVVEETSARSRKLCAFIFLTKKSASTAFLAWCVL
jgi:hypothetical protein